MRFSFKMPYFFHKSLVQNDEEDPLLHVKYSLFSSSTRIWLCLFLFSIWKDEILYYTHTYIYIFFGHSNILHRWLSGGFYFQFCAHVSMEPFILMRFDAIFTFWDNEVMHKPEMIHRNAHQMIHKNIKESFENQVNASGSNNNDEIFCTIFFLLLLVRFLFFLMHN